MTGEYDHQGWGKGEETRERPDQEPGPEPLQLNPDEIPDPEDRAAG